MIIARREYQALVRTKAFIISLVLMPIFMLGGIFLQVFLNGRVDVSEKKVVVLDGTGRIFAPLEAMAEQRNGSAEKNEASGKKARGGIALEQGPASAVTDEERLELSDRIRHNEIFAFVEIDADALQPGKDKAQNQTPVRVYSESIAHDDVARWLMQSIQRVTFALRLQDSGLDSATVAKVVMPVGIEELGLFSHSAGGEIRNADQGARNLNLFIPFGLVMLMFMSLMIVCQPMLTSVLEEKQQRIAEVLLGSASPFQLMMGKLIGNVCVALSIVGLYMLGGYLVAAHYGYADMLPLWLIGWFLTFEILASVLYGSVFIAVGAACSDLKDSQSLLMPAMLFMIFPLMVWFNVLQEPLSSFAVWVSLFPPATPMLMLLRLAASPMVPMWQAALGILLVLVTAMVCVFAAGRVFRIGILAQGKAPKLNELARWVVRG
jgi:ABC-2 type transport system permease protein